MLPRDTSRTTAHPKSARPHPIHAREGTAAAPTRHSPVRGSEVVTSPFSAAALWVLSLLALEITLRSSQGLVLTPWQMTLAALAVLGLFASSWHLLWIGLARVTSLPWLPRRTRQALTMAVAQWGGKSAKRILRAGVAGAVVTSAVGIGSAAAWADQPADGLDLLWPDSPVSAQTILPERESPQSPVNMEQPLPEIDFSAALQVEEEGIQEPPQVQDVPSPILSVIAAAADPAAPPVPIEPPGDSSSTAASSVEPLSVTSSAATLSGGQSIEVASVPALEPPPKTSPEPTAVSYRVQSGDSLWSIAQTLLKESSESGRSAADATAIDELWRAIYRDNRTVIGADPGLILPDTQLMLPAL